MSYVGLAADLKPQLTKAEALLAFMKLVDEKLINGHKIRVLKPQYQGQAEPGPEAKVGLEMPAVVHGVSFSKVTKGAAVQNAAAHIKNVRVRGDAVVLSLAFAEPGTDEVPSSGNIIATRKAAKVAALNVADPTSFVLFEPSAGWEEASAPLPGKDVPPAKKDEPVPETKPAELKPEYIAWGIIGGLSLAMIWKLTR